MKSFICKECKERKDETEFSYNFFREEYCKICSNCEREKPDHPDLQKRNLFCM